MLNARPMRLYRVSRRELFEQLDRPALRPLPAEPFVYWTNSPLGAVGGVAAVKPICEHETGAPARMWMLSS